LGALELTLGVTAAANAIARGIPDDDELALLSAVFMQLADTLATIAAKRALCESRCAKEKASLPPDPKDNS